MPDIDKYYDPNFLSKFIFDEGEVKTLTIKKVVSQDVFTPGKNDTTRMPIVYFKEKCLRKDENNKVIKDAKGRDVIEDVKPLILNKTNKDIISRLYGRDTDFWIDKQISIYVDKSVKVRGEKIGGLRIKSFVQKPKEAIFCEECSSEIKGTEKQPNPANIAIFTQKRYGKKLCAACANNKEKEGKKDE